MVIFFLTKLAWSVMQYISRRFSQTSMTCMGDGNTINYNCAGREVVYTDLRFMSCENTKNYSVKLITCWFLLYVCYILGVFLKKFSYLAISFMTSYMHAAGISIKVLQLFDHAWSFSVAIYIVMTSMCIAV